MNKKVFISEKLDEGLLRGECSMYLQTPNADVTDAVKHMFGELHVKGI